MDRTEGSNFIDIGGGRRGFQDQNAEAGVPGTRVTAAFLNSLQEEIMAVIENAGLPADKANWQQLDAAIRKLAAKIVNDYNIPLAQLNCLPWLPVISLTQKTPPAKPAPGDIYIVPDDGKGEWIDKAGQIAEWNGSKWLFSSTKDGHGIGLPAGSIYIKIAGKYVLLTDLLDKRYSRLTAPPADTFYVVGPSGSDQNTGLKPTAEEGFATIQGAINAISGRYITQGTITLKISPGKYDGFSVTASLVQSWKIIGDTSNPANVIISAQKRAEGIIRGCSVFSGSVQLLGLSFSAICECVAAAGGDVKIIDCHFQCSANSTTINCFSSSLSLFGNVTFAGNCSSIFGIGKSGSVAFGYGDMNTTNPVTVIFNAVTCDAFLNMNTGGSAIIIPQFCHFTGGLKGMKYMMSLNASILLNGAGNEFLPGDKPGICTTGAQVS